MRQPPPQGNPYEGWLYLPPANAGTIGVTIAWDAARQFWGGVINESWTDIAYAMQGGTLV